jgi:hypothetical protein
MSKLDAALFYAKVLPVFPLIPNTKDPLIKGSWKEYKTQDEAQIRAWWTQYPDANIALPMGGPILCSDLDCKGGDDGWASYQAVDPGEISAPIQRTPSGGFHVMHGFVEGLINFTHKGVHRGIDLRTQGGYIVVSPSYIDGDRYEWLQGGPIVPLGGALGGEYYKWSTESTVDRDVDMPDPTPIDDLPPLEGTVLRQKHLDFLHSGFIHESYNSDRSAALLGATIALYQLGLSDEDVLGYLEGSSGALECAVAHATDRRAGLWLWKYNCIKAREKSGTTPMVNATEAFQGIDATVVSNTPLPDVPMMSEKERWISVARGLNQDQHDEAVEVYRAADLINPLFADQIANIIHESTGFRKSDIEKWGKKISKDIAKSMRLADDSPVRRTGTGLPIGHPVLEKAPLSVESWQDAVGRYVFIKSENKWFDRHTRHCLTTEAVNATHADTIATLTDPDDKLRFTDALAMRHDTLKVDVQSYWPGINETLIHVGESDAVNTWKPSSLPMYTGDITPWWELLCHLFPEEGSRDRIMDWMAFIIQNPHIKVNHALLVGGGERIGKDTVFVPFVRSVGIENVSNIKAEMLDEKYDDPFINVKLAVIQEVFRSGFKDAKFIENKLKVYLADPPEELMLRRLGSSHIKQRNLIQMLIFTNYKEALHLTSGSGDRYLCEWSDAGKLTPEDYTKIYNWYDYEYGCEKVYAYLMARDVSHYKPKAAAPKTTWREDIHTSVKSDMDHAVEDIIDQVIQSNDAGRVNRASGGTVTAGNAHLYHEVLYITPGQILDKMDPKFKTTSRTITTIMTQLGLVRVDGHTADHRHRVPREFVEATFSAVHGPDRFKGTIKATVFLLDPSRSEALDPTPEALKLGLCPSYLINDYLSSIN